MKTNIYYALIVSALILTCGCKKSLKSDSSVALTSGAKATFPLNPEWQTPTATGRIIRFDIGDGNGSDCLFTYDIGTGHVSLTQVSGSGGTTIYSGTGIPIGNGVPIDVTQDNGDCSDNYNEVGGVHVIPYDATGNGREDHLLVYIPGHGILYLLSYLGNGLWYEDWTSSTGIGGYDLAGASHTDKIIAYDFGSGSKNALICYRPGNKYVWVIQNQNGSLTSPNWVAAYKSGSGIGGFDMSDVRDQLIEFGEPAPKYMQLAAYRPGTGYIWLMYHNPNSTTWLAPLSSRSGWPSFSFADNQDRIVTVPVGTVTPAEAEVSDVQMFPYRPGPSGLAASPYIYQEDGNGGNLSYQAPYPGLGSNYSLTHNPYGSPATGVGDHILSFSPNGEGNGGLLFYSNGGGNQSQIYELGSDQYNWVY